MPPSEDDVSDREQRHYPVACPDITEAESSRVADAVRSTWISSTGPYLAELEQVFGEACGTSHVIPVANGTVALHLALVALGIGRGDEVIVPAMTYVATANAVTYTGATPVFADVSSETWCLDPDHVAALISPRTVAIIAVHLYGHPADMDRLGAIARRHSLALVEDAAEAPFASCRGRMTGSMGNVAAFSFYSNKVITSGEGGAITTNDELLAQRMRALNRHGMDPDRRYYFPVIGYNYRLTNVAAAMLCGQMSRLDELLRRRTDMFAAYDEALSACPRIERRPIAAWSRPTPWLYSILVQDADTGVRDEIIGQMAQQRVETRPLFVPLHLLPPYQAVPAGRLPVAEDLGSRGISLPTSSVWEPKDAHEIASRMLRVLEGV